MTVSTTSNESDWIANAQQGDRQAFGELVGLHRQGVINVVYRLCGDPQLAEEAAQESFVRAWQNIRRYNPRFAFRNWVYRIALNVAFDALRRSKPLSDIEAEPLTAGGESPEAAVERKEQAAQVQQAVLGLPPASRAVLILREYEGLTYREIAEALDIPIGTVMSRLSYARSQLRQALGQRREAL